MEEREDGYYWVKINSRWEIAGYCKEIWEVMGKERNYFDNEIEEIGAYIPEGY